MERQGQGLTQLQTRRSHTGRCGGIVAPTPDHLPAERYRGRPLCTPRSCLRQVPRMSHSLCPAPRAGSLALTCQGPATRQKHTRPGPAADFSVCQTEVLLQNKSTPTATGLKNMVNRPEGNVREATGSLLVSERVPDVCQVRTAKDRSSTKPYPGRVIAWGLLKMGEGPHKSVRSPQESDLI